MSEKQVIDRTRKLLAKSGLDSKFMASQTERLYSQYGHAHTAALAGLCHLKDAKLFYKAGGKSLTLVADSIGYARQAFKDVVKYLSDGYGSYAGSVEKFLFYTKKAPTFEKFYEAAHEDLLDSLALVAGCTAFVQEGLSVGLLEVALDLDALLLSSEFEKVMDHHIEQAETVLEKVKDIVK